MTSPDPVTEAAAYQRHLLDALGDDDPATAQAETPAVIRELIADAGADLRTSPEPGEWSVLECIAHVVDAELVVSGRYRWILAHDEPELLGYDQDLWVNALHHRDDDPATLVALFEGLRAANLDLWRRTPAQDRERIGLHRERGPESYDLTFRLAAGHDRVHLGQARAALATVRQVVGDPAGVAPR
jgi:DinB superfamily